MVRLLAFHLLNDYSGSPKVLFQILSRLSSVNDITLVTSNGGILDSLQEKGVKIHHFYYCFKKNKVITILLFLYAQIACFFLGLKYGRNRIFYINTILPIGATIAAKVLGRPIVYHYHENAKAKGPIYRLLSRLMLKSADKIICVSENQASTLPKSKKIVVIPNAIPKSFEDIIDYRFDDAFRHKRILMLCSLKKYKGINEFCRLAENMPNYRFELVINDTELNIKEYFEENCLPQLSNLIWHSRQSDVLPFYLKSAVVLNLSNKNEIVETFGLTAIEAIACGRPVIGPTVGGISEIIIDGFNGYKIDLQDLGQVKKAIEYILSKKEIFMEFCHNSLSLKPKYSEVNIVNQINNVICSL
ncbi:MAG: glycosyltransferase family 4 protein [Muribaculaceae bacterium]|nr:glycosyltransferase family 4 protein [Muribaculaceae bacterium]